MKAQLSGEVRRLPVMIKAPRAGASKTRLVPREGIAIEEALVLKNVKP